MTSATDTSTLRALARREISNYARSVLFLAGLAGTVAVTITSFTSDDDGTSSTMNMIAPAAFIGLLGLIVMATLTTRSDRAAAAAGAIAAGQRTRTLALLAAVVVPLTAALLWFAGAVLMYRTQPPSPAAVPFGPIGDAHVLAVIFALGVMPAIGGPILGLVVARWVPWRGAAVVAVVVIVLITIVMQGNFEATWRWRVVWPWTYWYGPLGWNTAGTDDAHWVALPGSPGCWLVYLAALCTLGALVALYRDPEANHPRLRAQIAVTVAVAVLALVLTMTLGLDAAVRNPLSGNSF